MYSFKKLCSRGGDVISKQDNETRRRSDRCWRGSAFLFEGGGQMIITEMNTGRFTQGVN